MRRDVRVGRSEASREGEREGDLCKNVGVAGHEVGVEVEVERIAGRS